MCTTPTCLRTFYCEFHIKRKHSVAHFSYSISLTSESDVSIVLHFQLCAQQYELKNTSVIKEPL